MSNKKELVLHPIHPMDMGKKLNRWLATNPGSVPSPELDLKIRELMVQLTNDGWFNFTIEIKEK